MGKGAAIQRVPFGGGSSDEGLVLDGLEGSQWRIIINGRTRREYREETHNAGTVYEAGWLRSAVRLEMCRGQRHEECHE